MNKVFFLIINLILPNIHFDDFEKKKKRLNESFSIYVWQ